MIIVEGLNRCGKTTLAMELRRRLGRFSYRHTTRPMKEVGPFNYRLWQLADAHPFMIVDRCHWSDYAYAHGAVFQSVLERGPGLPVGRGAAGGNMVPWRPIDKTEVGLTFAEWRLLELAFMSRGATVLMLWDNADAIRSRWTDYPIYRDPGADGLKRLMARYHSLLTGQGCDVEGEEPGAYTTRLRRTGLTLPEAMDEDFLRGVEVDAFTQAARTGWMFPPSLGIGGPDAEFMVISDCPAAGPPIGVVAHSLGGSAPDVPFGRGDLDKSWWDASDRVGVDWWRGYYTWASAFRNDPRQLAGYVATCLPKVKAVVCLGAVAEATVRQAFDDGREVAGMRIGSLRIPLKWREANGHVAEALTEEGWTRDMRALAGEVLGDYVGIGGKGIAGLFGKDD